MKKKIMIKALLLSSILCSSILNAKFDGQLSLKESTVSKVLAAALSAYNSKATRHDIFKLIPIIRGIIKNNPNISEAEAQQKTREFIEKYMPKEGISSDIQNSESVSKEAVHELVHDVIFEVEIPLSMVQGAIEKQLSIWKSIKSINSQKNLQWLLPDLTIRKIQTAEYVLANLKRINFSLRTIKWLTDDKVNSSAKKLVKKISTFNQFAQQLESCYKSLRSMQSDPEEELTGEEVLSIIQSKMSKTTVHQSNESDDEHLAKEILHHVTDAITKTSVLYEYAISGISDNNEKDKESKITELIFLLAEVFKEIETFGQHIESGISQLIKNLEKEIKRSKPSEEEKANLSNLKLLLNIIKAQKYAGRVIDFILNSKSTLCIMIKKALHYNEEDSLAMRLAKKVF